MAATDQDAFALLDALFAHAPVGLGFWDADLRYRRINAALAAINGVPPLDHLGRRTSDVLGGPLSEEVDGLMRTVLASGEPVLDVELTGETPAAPGVERSWLAHYYPVPGPAGATVGVGAIILEVTAERRATERAQRAVRERRTTTALLDAIFAAAPVGLSYFDTDRRYRRVNDALAELNALSVEAHLGRRPGELFGPYGDELERVIFEVLATGRPVVDRELERDVAGSRRFREGTWFPVHGPDGEVAGVGGVVRDITAQHETDAERTRLLKDALTSRAQAEAAQIRAENAQEEAEAARRGTEFLARAGERLAVATREYERTLQEVARVAVPAIADWCTFTLVEPRGTLRTVAIAAGDPELQREAAAFALRFPPRLDAAAGVGRAIATGESQLVRQIPVELLDDLAHDDEQLAFLRRLGMRSGLTVPLLSGGRPIGALSFVYAQSGREYGPDDVTLAESLAVRAALAVENARLLDERSHIAQTLQRSLLPPALPDVEGVELAARYRAAGDQNEVGGDFYDVFRAGDGRWTYVIGDVSGKGAEAAAVTSLTRHTLRAAALSRVDPGETLGLLNDALLAAPDPAGRFCTVLVARTCGRTQDGALELELSTGGHLPPLVVRSGGRVERIQLRGAIVGGLDRPHFGQCTVLLAPGDLLVMFTDGVTELRSQDPHFGEAALEEVLRATRGAPVDEVVEAIERSAVDLQDGEPRDDIALLALRAAP